MEQVGRWQVSLLERPFVTGGFVSCLSSVVSKQVAFSTGPALYGFCHFLIYLVEGQCISKVWES